MDITWYLQGGPREGYQYPPREGCQDPKFKVGDHVRISKYKKKIVKDYVLNWSEEVCFHGHMLLVILKVKKLFERFTKKELQKNNQKKLG